MELTQKECREIVENKRIKEIIELEKIINRSIVTCSSEGRISIKIDLKEQLSWHISLSYIAPFINKLRSNGFGVIIGVYCSEVQDLQIFWDKEYKEESI